LSTRQCDKLTQAKSHDPDTQRSDCDRCTSWCDRPCEVPYYKCTEQYDTNSGASNKLDLEDEAPHCSAWKVETKTVCFKDQLNKNEDCELEDLVTQLHRLRTWDSSYTAVYA
jgi:hypothetical protein